MPNQTSAMPPMHVIGVEGIAGSLDPIYGDIRDKLLTVPHWGGPGHAYAVSDIFTVRHQLIQELDPAPRSAFEFGALLGYFLITALDAAPSISRVGWIDLEVNMPNSNQLCAENLHDYRTGLELFSATETRRCVEFGAADLVQVDAAHSYPDCLTDLVWALMLDPHVIFVDDYKAIEGVRRATDEFARWQGLKVEYHDTVNGLAVLRF